MTEKPSSTTSNQLSPFSVAGDENLPHLIDKIAHGFSMPSPKQAVVETRERSGSNGLAKQQTQHSFSTNNQLHLKNGSSHTKSENRSEQCRGQHNPFANKELCLEKQQLAESRNDLPNVRGKSASSINHRKLSCRSNDFGSVPESFSTSYPQNGASQKYLQPQTDFGVNDRIYPQSRNETSPLNNGMVPHRHQDTEMMTSLRSNLQPGPVYPQNNSNQNFSQQNRKFFPTHNAYGHVNSNYRVQQSNNPFC